MRLASIGLGWAWIGRAGLGCWVGLGWARLCWVGFGWVGSGYVRLDLVGLGCGLGKWVVD